jgi:hypothetical protein
MLGQRPAAVFRRRGGQRIFGRPFARRLVLFQLFQR